MSPIVISIILQWLLIVGLIVICLVMLAELGKLKSTVYANTRPTAALAIDSNGPERGTALPPADKLASYHPQLSRYVGNESRSAFICLFLSVYCESCHDLVDGINRLVERNDMLDVLVVMRGSATDVQNFQNVFKLNCDVIPDETGTIALEAFGIRQMPFGLLYGPGGKLQNKGLLLAGQQSIEALIGEEGLLQESDQALFSHGNVETPV